MYEHYVEKFHGLPAELLTRRQLFNSLQVPCSFNYHDRKGLGLKVSQNGRCQSKKKDLALFIDVLSALFPRLFVAVMDTNVKISIPSWSYTPVKRMFPPDHPFFEEGELFCNVLKKELDNSEEVDTLMQRAEFQCDIPGCGEWFSSVPSYEAHYNSLHRHCCQKCQRSFPSTHLLEIHILENHDMLFNMIAMRKNLYKCLVESCPDRFSSDEERKDHLVSLHKYPSDFRFNRPSRQQRKSKSMQTSPEAMDTSTLPQEPAPSVNTAPKQRLPKTICFGRGSSRAFQKSIPKNSKKKSKNLDDIQDQAASQEVTMAEVS
nr:zinc finger protein 511-like [Pocillopora verrucosa]